MISTLTLGGLGLCAVTATVLAMMLAGSRRRVRVLEDALRASTESQRRKDSLLTRRSELDSIKDEFISNVSHELRTPLTSIRGALGLLSAGLMGNVDGKAQNLLRIALTNTDRLVRLINDILDLERMQSGRAPLSLRRCSMRDLAVQSIDTMTTMADAAEVALELELAAPPDSVYFDGDSDRVLQVLANLLSNAIKFSPRLGSITIRVEANQESVLVRVSDQGRGIPVDKLDSIFDRFQQVEDSDSKQKGGTGLGLAICRTIVNQHNGSIWAESNPQHHRGPGASLLMALPRIARTQDVATAPRVSMLEVPVVGTIVLCDDDSGIRTVVGENLRQQGYKVLEADSGREAILLSTSQPVQAILLDLYMPGMSGLETLQILKRDKRTAAIPVIVLSVLSPAGTPSGPEIASTAQGWVQKPFNEHLLLAELSRVLRRGIGNGRVLFVEDDDDLASTIIAALEESAHVDHARTRHDAMEHCRLSRPDLLLLDVALPDGDVYSFCDWLRQQPELNSVPVVVYSGRELSAADRRRLTLGPTRFLQKGNTGVYEVDELVTALVDHLRAHSPQGQPTPVA